MDLFSAIASERRSLADLLEHLTPDQQEAQSLCNEWTVKQVAAHLVMPMEVGMLAFMAAMLRHRGNFDAANSALAKKQALRPFAEIVQTLRDKADHRFTPPGQGPEAPLTDIIVHGLDITTPLGLSHHVPDEHLVVVLNHLAEPSPKSRAASRQLDGVRLQADDLEWTHGDGPLVTGPARAILLALAGRDAGWNQLTGDVPPRSA